MLTSPALWQLALARIEGAQPFLSPHLSEALALASLRRLWRIHVQDFTFKSIGLEHDPGRDAHELVRSWYAVERRDFLSWIIRRAPPALAAAARRTLTAKSCTESFSVAFAPADAALDRLDALLPSNDPMPTLLDLVAGLRAEETDFLEGGSEIASFGGFAIIRSAPRGAAWAASLAVAMRPHLFRLGGGSVALAGVLPRGVFRERLDEPASTLIQAALLTASAHAQDDLHTLYNASMLGDKILASLNASSSTPHAWLLICGLGPLTRAELARALGVTRRTASVVVSTLERMNLVRLRPEDGAILPIGRRGEG